MKLLYQNIQTKKAIEQLVKEAKEVRFAVAFWGKGASETIVNAKGKKVKIICNLESGASNPHEIIKIGKLIGFNNIRSVKNLHAKVYLTNNKMILGSSNFSANGLSLEGDETNKLIEANILLDNASINQDAKVWFDDLWNKAKQIDKNYCERFIDKWITNRSRISNQKIERDFFKAYENGEYSQAKIYLTIDTTGFTKEEEIIGDQAAKESVNSDLYYLGKEISYWYDYPELPRDAYIVSYFYSKKKKLTNYGIYKTLPKKYDRKGYQFCYKVSSSPLRKKHLVQITSVLKQNISKIKIHPADGTEIELSKFYKVFRPKEK